MSESKEKDNKEGLFPRRYLLIAAGYLVTVVLLLSLVVLKWGRAPVSELPGNEQEIEGGLLEGGLAEEEPEPAEEPLEEKKEEEEKQNAYEQHTDIEEETMEEETMGRDNPDSGGLQGSPETERDEERPKESAAAQLILPLAASPLPQWELYRSFGSYVTEVLPSGGRLHTLSKGAYFLATPGAPVAALWDGLVVKVDKSSLLLQHEGGYATYYSNLREVWVEEGHGVSRGENIGLMPQILSKDEAMGSPSPPASGSVPIKTIWKGYAGEKQAVQPEADFDLETAAMKVLADGKALLYLEVRQGNSFLDPLQFIPARN